MIKKVQFSFNQEAYEHLLKLQSQYNASTLAQTLRIALGLAEFINEKLLEGYTALLEKDGEIVIIDNPYFPKYKPNP